MSVNVIKKLREMTSLGIKDCKKALDEANGEFDGALRLLKKKGARVLAQKSGRSALQGLIDSYVHFGGNLGAIVEVNCETDFVARTDVFKKFVKDIAMHIAALGPKYIKRQDIPREELDGVENVDDYCRDNCLLEQVFVKDNKVTIDDYLKEVVSQTGENILIKRFVRFSLGEV